MAQGQGLGGNVHVDDSIDLYDSDILKIETALNALMEHQGKRMIVENFRKEAIERFAAQGFVVEVLTWETDQPGLYAFDFKITGRVERLDEFDHERQSHEVVNDLLGIDPDKKGERVKPTEGLRALQQKAQDDRPGH